MYQTGSLPFLFRLIKNMENKKNKVAENSKKRKNKAITGVIIICPLVIILMVAMIVVILKDNNSEERIQAVYEDIPVQENINTGHIDEEESEQGPREVVWKENYPALDSIRTRDENEAIRSSYAETMERYEQAKKIIEENDIDFSDIKITVLGDSLTDGMGLEDHEKAEYNWPTQLQKILNCRDVVNMGIIGSTVENLKDRDPMYLRWRDIDKDSDIIIVMGGTNDALNQEYYDIGSPEERAENTFCGDLSEMLKGIKATYQTKDHYCKLIYINPPYSGISAAYQAMRPDEFLDQKEYAQAINEIAVSEGFEVIDLFNNNILNSCDSETYEKLYNIDGLHFNKEGYTVMANYVASQIILRIE